MTRRSACFIASTLYGQSSSMHFGIQSSRVFTNLQPAKYPALGDLSHVSTFSLIVWSAAEAAAAEILREHDRKKAALRQSQYDVANSGHYGFTNHGMSAPLDFSSMRQQMTSEISELIPVSIPHVDSDPSLSTTTAFTFPRPSGLPDFWVSLALPDKSFCHVNFERLPITPWWVPIIPWWVSMSSFEFWLTEACLPPISEQRCELIAIDDSLWQLYWE